MVGVEEQHTLAQQYAQAMKDLEETQRDYGPELMERIWDMVNWFEDDVLPCQFYQSVHTFKPDLNCIKALSEVYRGPFRNVLASGE